MLKLIQLNYFVSTVEAGSVTTAARNLFISQPALSKQLVQLENELKCELFLRKTTGIELTEAGEYFYQKAKDLLRAAEELSVDMEQFSQKGSLKIGALPSIGTHFLPAIVGGLRDQYKIEVLIKDTTDELISLVENNQADFVFVQDALVTRTLVVEHLFWEPYDAIVPYSSANHDKSLFSISEFVDNQLIIHKQPCDIRTFFENYCRDKRLDYDIAIELETNESIVAFVSSGMGSSIIPRMVSQHIRSQSVVIKPFDGEKMGRSVDLLYKPSLKSIAKIVLALAKENTPDW